ncbi:MAG: hypothetical protein ACRENU_08240 [Gemmatimonadaceae bacterium]
MTDHLKLHPDGDEETTRGLQRIYAAPQEDSYWKGLEARILSRLTSTPTIAWWDELDRWMRPALAAAAVVLVAAGVAMVRAYQVDQESTYEAMLTPTSLPVETAVRPVLQDKRDGTFRYLMTVR